ncbi:plasma membrane fusion protein prm1 [Mortierella alpina]|nr:plasma membrane fusion protein prm1 [Mortierella alpina]
MTALEELSDVIRNHVTGEIQNASVAFASSTNVVLSQLEFDLNNRIFGPIVYAAGDLDSGLKAVQATMVEGIQAVFGEGALSNLVLAVLQCLFFNKLAIVKTGLAWLQENANIKLPRLSEHVLMPEQLELDNLLTTVMGHRIIAPSFSSSLPSGRLSEGGGTHLQREIRMSVDTVTKVLDLYENELKKDILVHYSLVGVWCVLLAMGLVGARGLKAKVYEEHGFRICQGVI